MAAFTEDGEPHPVYAIAHLPQDQPFNEAMYTGGSVNLSHYSHTAERQPRSTAPVRSGVAAPATAR